jgi:voltage-gated potassium channel
MLIERLRRPRSASELLVARLTGLTIIIIVSTFALALLFYLFEHDAARTEIHTYGDALFWIASQLTSVSSSLPNPVTTGGKILAVGIDVIAISAVTLLLGTIVQHSHLMSPLRAAYFERPDDSEESR